MIDKVISNTITIGLILLVFAWATLTLESQLESIEFINTVYAFQVLAGFDDGAFNEGDANYVILSINRGYIEIENETYNITIRVLINNQLVFERNYCIKTIIPSYRAGWLISTLKKYYRGSETLISNSTIIFMVYTEQRNGARIFIRPRIRFYHLGSFMKDYRISIVNIYIPILIAGESGGASPFKIYFRTSHVSREVFEVDGGNNVEIIIILNDQIAEFKVDSCDKLVLNIIKSNIKFGVRGV